MRIETVADRVLSAAKSGEQAPHLHIAACWCARAVTRARESRGLVGRTAVANAGAPEGFRRHAVRTTEISRAFRGCAPRFAQAAWLRPPRSGAEGQRVERLRRRRRAPGATPIMSRGPEVQREVAIVPHHLAERSEEHTSELQSRVDISY